MFRQIPSGLHEQNGVAALTLDERGNILDCNIVAEELFGYDTPELLCHHISFLMPQFAGADFIDHGHINAKISYMCHCGHLFPLLDSKSKLLYGEVHIVELSISEIRTFRLILPLESVVPELPSG